MRSRHDEEVCNERPPTARPTPYVIKRECDDHDSQHERERERMREPTMPQHVAITYAEREAHDIHIRHDRAEHRPQPETPSHPRARVRLAERDGDEGVREGRSHWCVQSLCSRCAP